MSLLDQMKGLDTSGIASARGSITVSVNADGLQGLISGGAAESVLGALGAALAQVRSLENPRALLGPVIEAVGSLKGNMSTDGLPLGELAGAIGEAVEIIISIFRAIEDGDITRIALPNGKSVSDMAGSVAEFAGRYTGVNLNEVNELRGLIDTVDGGMHGNAGSLVEMAIKLLLPFDHDGLGSIRSSVDHILKGATSIHLQAGATAPLLAAFDVVAAAAASGDAARLNAALRDLERARQNALELFRRGFAGYVSALEALDLARHLGVIGDAATMLRSGKDSMLEFMERIKNFLAHLREMVENITTDDVVEVIGQLAGMLEAMVKHAVEDPINRAVEDVKEWVRGLFAHIPLRHYRNELTSFIHGIAQAIKDADLDRYAREARAFLDEVASVIDGADLTGGVQEALQAIKDAVDATLGEVKEALETIVGEVNAIADTASTIIEEAATQLEAFQAMVEEVATLLESIDFEQAGAEVIGRLHELRLTAEKLLSAAPLPDSMRPLVEQLIDTLDGLDFDMILAPVHNAAKQFKIPPAALDTVNRILDEAGRLAKDLITPELIASIDVEIQHVIDEIRKLDPSSLFEEVSKYIDEAADFIEGLDPRPAVHELREPFDMVLAGIDAADPRRLLAPVIDTYDSLMREVNIPAPDSVMKGIGSLINTAGEKLGSTLAAPLESLTGGSAGISSGGASSGNGSSGSGSSGSGSSGSGAGGSGGSGSGSPGGAGSGGSASGSGNAGATNVAPQIPDVRAGDLIRLMGYLPNKIREALHALDAGAMGDVLRRIDAVSGGLARDLRRVAAELWAVEERIIESLEQMMMPLGDAQIKVQLAIGAHFKAGNASLDLNVAMHAVAMAGPGPMRAALAAEMKRARDDARRIIAKTGGSAGATLERAAAALERSSLAKLSHDADALLAALDPEPVAAELDALVAVVLARLPELTGSVGEALQAAAQRLIDMMRIFNPTNQAQKFLSVFDVVREELDILNPRRLANELGEVHAAIRGTIAAYDPDVFAQEVYDVVMAVAGKLRSLDPAHLLGDLDLFSDITELIEGASPSAILSKLDTALDDLGDRLQSLDLGHLVEAVEEVPDEIVTGVEVAVKGIRDEVKALLESIRYASGGGSVSVSASVEAHA